MSDYTYDYTCKFCDGTGVWVPSEPAPQTPEKTIAYVKLWAEAVPPPSLDESGLKAWEMAQGDVLAILTAGGYAKRPE